MMSLPFCQAWIAERAGYFLSDFFETHIRIGRIHATVFGHIIIDNIHMHDQQGRRLIDITRTGAKINLKRLLIDKQFVFNSAQIYGATANIIQDQKDSSLNIQFIIDRFTSKGNKKKPLPHIEVHTLMVRHTHLSFNREGKPHKKTFDPNHIRIHELSITGMFNVLNSDTIDVVLRRMSFTESSGIHLRNLTGRLQNGPTQGISVKDLSLNIGDHNDIRVAHANYCKEHIEGELEASILPSELSMFYTPMGKCKRNFSTQLRINGNLQCLQIEKFNLHDDQHTVALDITGEVCPKGKQTPDFNLNINNFSIDAGLEEITQPFINKDIPLLGKLRNTNLRGNIRHTDNVYSGNINTASPLGNIMLQGSYDDGHLDAIANVEQLQLGTIISLGKDTTGIIGPLTAKLNVNGRIKGRNNMPEGEARAVIQEVALKGYKYHHLKASASHRGQIINAQAEMGDSALLGTVQCHINTSRKNPVLQGLADIEHFNLRATHLLRKESIESIQLKMGIDFHGNSFDNMQGNLSIPHIIITNDSLRHTFTNIQLLSQPIEDERHIQLQSPYLKASVDGVFQTNDLLHFAQKTGHRLFPDFIKNPQSKDKDAHVNLSLTINNLKPLRDLLHVDVALEDGPLTAQARINTALQQLDADIHTPSLRYKKQTIKNISLRLDNTTNNIVTQLHAEPNLKGIPMQVDFNARLIENYFTTNLSWNAQHEMRNEGEIRLTGSTESFSNESFGFLANVEQTQFYINDTLWTIHPSQLFYHDKSLNVNNFVLSMPGGERSLRIQGTASRDWKDSLLVDLKMIDLGYVLTLAKLKPVSLGGLVTGRLIGRNMFKNPVATGHVVMPEFYLNAAPMGNLDAGLSWNVQPGSLLIKGHLQDDKENSFIDVDGDIHLLRDPIDYIDIDINCRKANAAFMQRYVTDIMERCRGRVSGHVRVFGPMKMVDMTAEAYVDWAALSIPVLNTRYYTYGDSLYITPGKITFKNIRAYDKNGVPGRVGEHTGLINGELRHDHFANLNYDISIQAENMLAYDTHEFGDDPFYATCYGTGKVSLQGKPNKTQIDVDVTPLKGTTLTYNATNPDALTEAGFLSFVDRSKMYLHENSSNPASPQAQTSGDLKINFNVKLTPDVQIRLLMDARTGDYITLYGQGNMVASYYNKGDFLIYGVCHVCDGTYKLTLQDVIRKDFLLRKDGTISFNGPPMQADLDVQAIYVVPAVSLKDISARSTFSNESVRVNCLMNINGKAESPNITFDFELPNVNEEEVRMVRSLISTEEERNLQVIYLLGLGRFYTYDYSTNPNTNSSAMNSLLSSTLSGQINQVMRNLLGNTDWNFGTHLATGQMGWREMDVEGMLSGRLLNNRLLINGNFGYRDNPVAKTNFIGDFDIQYLLSRNGNVILKAYSETNDRYFTKTSLTTQGIGLMLKRDFTGWRDFFGNIHTRKNRERKRLKQELIITTDKNKNQNQ